MLMQTLQMRIWIVFIWRVTQTGTSKYIQLDYVILFNYLGYVRVSERVSYKSNIRQV